MKYIYTLLLIFTVLLSHSQRFSIGAETGFLAITTDKVGILAFSKATGITYGTTGTWYLNPNVALNASINSGKIELWPDGRFYQLPVSISYSPTYRGQLNRTHKRDLPNRLLTLGFLPQTVEIEGGLSMRFYDGRYAHVETQSATIITGDRIESYNFKVERRNRVFTPSADIGLKWSLDFNPLHFYLRPRLSFLMVEDNLVRIEDFSTKQVTTGGSRFSFAMLTGIYFTFD